MRMHLAHVAVEISDHSLNFLDTLRMCDGRSIDIVSISGQYRVTGETEHVVVVASSVHFVYKA